MPKKKSLNVPQLCSNEAIKACSAKANALAYDYTAPTLSLSILKPRSRNILSLAQVRREVLLNFIPKQEGEEDQHLKGFGALKRVPLVSLVFSQLSWETFGGIGFIVQFFRITPL